MLNAKDANLFATKIRRQSRNLLVTINNLRGLRKTADALDAGNTLQDADLGGDNEGMTWAVLLPPLYATLDAIESLLAAGHATNLEPIAQQE